MPSIPIAGMTTPPAPILPGLCSVSFRKLPAAEIARRAAEAGLAAIEWGGDIHVPPGDLATARTVAKLTSGHGLTCPSYGSYWRAGAADAPPLAGVLACAQELGAPVVRIWAGSVDARNASGEVRRKVADALLAAADAAAQLGLRLSLESHDGTLTSTADSTARLLGQEAVHPALGCHWQPPHAESDAVCLANLAVVSPWLEHLHVFHWWPSTSDRRPLAEGAGRWARLLAVAAAAQRHPGQAAFLEFLPGDDPAALPTEAATLRRLISACAGS